MRPVRAEAGGGAALPRFFLRAAACFVLATGAWWFVKDIAAMPASWVAGRAGESLFSDVVRQAHVGRASLEWETYLRVDMTQMRGGRPMPRGVQAELAVDTQPARYGYSLPLLVALLLSGSRQRLPRNLALGFACLVPVQAFSVVADLLKQAVIGAGPAVAAQAGWALWQFNLLAYAYQLGALLLPTVAPVLLWLWLDRRFFAAVLVAGWLQHAQPVDRPPRP